jgi:hypothetical protein
MIARTWHRRVASSKSDAYYVLLKQRGLADYLPSHR